MRERPSQVVLPVIPKPPAGIPAALPACGSLRGEPCRAALGNGAASAVSATLHHHDAAVEWTAASPRPGTTLTGYRVVEQPDGATHDVGTAATATTFSALADGRHFFEVTAIYAGGVTVAATPSNTVSLPHRHRGDHHHKPHHPDGGHHPHDGHTPASCRAGARF